MVFLQQYRVPDLNTDYNQKLSWLFTTFQVVRFAFAVPVNHELIVSEFNLNLFCCNNPFMRQANHSRSMRFDRDLINAAALGEAALWVICLE